MARSRAAGAGRPNSSSAAAIKADGHARSWRPGRRRAESRWRGRPRTEGESSASATPPPGPPSGWRASSAAEEAWTTALALADAIAAAAPPRSEPDGRGKVDRDVDGAGPGWRRPSGQMSRVPPARSTRHQARAVVIRNPRGQRATWPAGWAARAILHGEPGLAGNRQTCGGPATARRAPGRPEPRSARSGRRRAG